MVWSGSFNLKPEEWTDDISMALYLSESLIEKNEFNARDQLQKYCKWYRNGYLSVNWKCFDIGPFCGMIRDILLETAL